MRAELMASSIRDGGYLLSFCIPIYNNIQANYKLITGILSNSSRYFQVVANDNCSSGDCTPLSMNIQDKRYSYYRNEYNIGAMPNWCRALERADGDYLYLVMGGNRLNYWRIDTLLDQICELKEKNIKLAIDRTIDTSNIRILSYVEEKERMEGVNELSFGDSIRRFINLGEHPTGLIIERKAFMDITERRAYFRMDYVYPETYIKRDILVKYKTSAIIHSGVYILGATYVDRRRQKSGVEFNSNSEKLYFSPCRKTDDFVRVVKMVKDIPPGMLNAFEKKRFFVEKWMELMEHVTSNWKTHNESKTISGHYGIKNRQVSMHELFKNLDYSYRRIIDIFELNGQPLIFPCRLLMRILIIKKRVELIHRWGLFTL